jgi:hypothetical protein
LQAIDRTQVEIDTSPKDVVVANGEIDSLRFGDILQIIKLIGLRGACNSHGGLYYVKKVTNNIKLCQYRQSFTLVRDDFGNLAPVVRP